MNRVPQLASLQVLHQCLTKFQLLQLTARPSLDQKHSGVLEITRQRFRREFGECPEKLIERFFLANFANLLAPSPIVKQDDCVIHDQRLAEEKRGTRGAV